MTEKDKSIFESLWFNAIMSAVSVAALIENVINRSYIMIIIWIVICYHFITLTMKTRNQ